MSAASSCGKAWCCLAFMWPASPAPLRWPGAQALHAGRPDPHPDDGAAQLPLARPAQPSSGLWQRVVIFMRRVGGVILTMTILPWFLASFPGCAGRRHGARHRVQLCRPHRGLVGACVCPLGFNWQISIALVPGMAAREVMVSSLGTVYALSATGEEAAQALMPVLAQAWSLPRPWPCWPGSCLHRSACRPGDGEARDRRLEDAPR